MTANQEGFPAAFLYICCTLFWYFKVAVVSPNSNPLPTTIFKMAEAIFFRILYRQASEVLRRNQLYIHIAGINVNSLLTWIISGLNAYVKRFRTWRGYRLKLNCRYVTLQSCRNWWTEETKTTKQSRKCRTFIKITKLFMKVTFDHFKTFVFYFSWPKGTFFISDYLLNLNFGSYAALRCLWHVRLV